MRPLTLALTICTFQLAFAQDWSKVILDEKLTLLLPGEVTIIPGEEKLRATAVAASGRIEIERTRYDYEVKHPSLDTEKAFADGYFHGTNYHGKISIVEEKKLPVGNLKGHFVLFRGSVGQLNQILFLGIEKNMYVIRFRERLAPSEADRQRLFASIEIR